MKRKFTHTTTTPPNDAISDSIMPWIVWDKDCPRVKVVFIDPKGSQRRLAVSQATTQDCRMHHFDLAAAGCDQVQRGHCAEHSSSATPRRRISGIFALLSLAGVLCTPISMASAQDWYYREGPLRGSLKSDQPLPLYDTESGHLWNRLFAVFYIRPSELPSRPEYPQDSTKLDEWDRKLRNGKLAPGPVL